MNLNNKQLVDKYSNLNMEINTNSSDTSNQFNLKLYFAKETKQDSTIESLLSNSVVANQLIQLIIAKNNLIVDKLFLNLIKTEYFKDKNDSFFNIKVIYLFFLKFLIQNCIFIFIKGRYFGTVKKNKINSSIRLSQL
jgi:hypothetical protein